MTEETGRAAPVSRQRPRARGRRRPDQPQVTRPCCRGTVDPPADEAATGRVCRLLGIHDMVAFLPAVLRWPRQYSIRCELGRRREFHERIQSVTLAVAFEGYGDTSRTGQPETAGTTRRDRDRDRVVRRPAGARGSRPSASRPTTPSTPSRHPRRMLPDRSPAAAAGSVGARRIGTTVRSRGRVSVCTPSVGDDEGPVA